MHSLHNQIKSSEIGYKGLQDFNSAKRKDSHHHNWEERDSTDDFAHRQLAPDHSVCILGHM